MNIPFSKSTVGEEEIEAVNRVIRSGWLAAGPETEAFEKEFAEYVGVKYAIFTNSGTSALKMAYKYFNEQGYDSYNLLTPNTFCATYSAAEEIGLREYDEWAKGIAYSIESQTIWPVVVATHYGGVKETDPTIILEDSAHRIEPNDPLIGKIRIYSFYVTKNMTTGAGGMFVTNDKEIYEKARLYWKDGLSSSTYGRLNGRQWDYRVLAMAGGYDGNDISATIGREQLKKLPDFNRRRNEVVNKYNKAFGQNWTGNHLYPYFLETEAEIAPFIAYMKEQGIACGYHYPKTCWLGVSLPLHPLLTDEEVEYIIKSVKEYDQLQS